MSSPLIPAPKNRISGAYAGAAGYCATTTVEGISYCSLVIVVVVACVVNRGPGGVPVRWPTVFSSSSAIPTRTTPCFVLVRVGLVKYLYTSGCSPWPPGYFNRSLASRSILNSHRKPHVHNTCPSLLLVPIGTCRPNRNPKLPDGYQPISVVSIV